MITVLCHREKTPWLKHRTQVLNYAVQGDGRKKKPVSLSNEKEQQSRGGKGQNKLENWSVCDFFWLRKLRKWCSNKHKWKIIKSWPTQYDLSDPTVSPQHWFQFCVKARAEFGHRERSTWGLSAELGSLSVTEPANAAQGSSPRAAMLQAEAASSWQLSSDTDQPPQTSLDYFKPIPSFFPRNKKIFLVLQSLFQ